jgi:hypothetical protein
MWLIDHQMNMLISEEFGQYFVRLPLSKSAKIVHGNSLRIDWQEVVPKDELSCILGNPPFYGYSLQTREQKEDLKIVFEGVKGAGILDYVAAWYIKAAQYISKTKIKVGFVSTNSIVQGEQVGILWNEMINKYGIKIHFAHRTFKWKNDAKGNAAVHVVIIGFANFNIKNKAIYFYDDINEEPHVIKAKNINPYLVDSKDILILRRNKPLNSMPEMVKGSSPTDGGHLILEDDEKQEFIKADPATEAFIRPYMGSREFINNIPRWCLWLKDISPKDLKALPSVLKRLELVKEMRLSSKKAATKKWAAFPALFIEERQPKGNYILIPRVSSERRKYIPIGYLDNNTIISDGAIALPDANKFVFGVLTSEMHMAWMKYTCGKLESRYRYSNTLVYNNFPWPKEPLEKNVAKVEAKAQKVLDVRAEFVGSSLADLYDPLTMPPKLVKAHQELDKAVDLCYRPQAFMNEAARIEYLFDLYNQYTIPLLNDSKKTKKEKVHTSVTIEN